MAYQLDFGIWGSIFAVPTAIVDKHIQLCGAASLKVLLVLLRHSQENITLQQISGLVGLSEADTQDALNYWIASGVIRCTPKGSDLLIEPQRTPQAPSQAPNDAPSPEAETEPAAEPIPEPAPESAPKEPRVVKLTSRPRLTPDIIAGMAQENGEIQSLIQEAQNLLGRPLSPSATESLVSLHTYGGMSVELVLMVIQYCVSIGKDSVRYIEATAYGWLDKGIDTLDKVERYLMKKTHESENEKKVRSAFGIHDRDLTAKETEFASRWIDVYHFDEPMLRLAYERTIDNKGKLSFPYCDGILSRWHEKGISTPRQATDEMNSLKNSALPERGVSPERPSFSGTREAPSFTGGSERERYDRAHTELQNRRNAARELHTRRREEIYARIPRVREIDAALSRTGFDVSRAVLMGGDASQLLQTLKSKNLSLQQEREEALIRAGYPQDYLDIPYHCRVCEDKGYRPDGTPCDCLKELLR